MSYPAAWKSRPGVPVTCPRDHWTGTIPNVNKGPRTWLYRGEGRVATCAACGYGVKMPQPAPRAEEVGRDGL